MQSVIKTTAAASPDGDPLEFVMSDGSVDRVGDIIEPAGWQLANFRKNPIALFGHRSDFVIGNWRDVRVEGDQLRGRLDLVAPVSERLTELHAAVNSGVLRAVSVGFRAVQAEPIEGSRAGGIRFLKSELVECSLVAVPANPNALQVAKALGLSRDTMGLIFGVRADEEDQTVRRAIIGVRAGNPSRFRGKPMTLSEKIEAGQSQLTALKDQLTEHLGKHDGTDMDDEAIAVTDELNQRIDAAQKQLDTLKRAEASLAAKSDPVIVPGGRLQQARPFAAPKKEIKPADYVYRAALVGVLSRIEQKPRDQVLRERYGEDEVTKIVSDLVIRAATVPATTTLTGWAAELVQTAIGDFIDSLMPQSVYPRLSAIGGRFTFGRNGIVSLPSRQATPTIAGSFVAEGAPIPVRQGAFQAVTLTPKKMGVISTFTRQIAEHSTPAIEQLIRQAMQEDTAVAIDSVLLDATAASATRPAGIRNGVSVTAATAGANFTALVTDIKNLVGVLAAANSLRSPVWIMNPVDVLSLTMTQNAGGDFPFAVEVNGGNLRGYPIIQSTSVTAHMVILLDAADFFSATGDEPRFDVSDQAVLHMEDTTPLAIVADGSPSDTVASPVRSLWQTDSIGIRMLLDINWAMRRTGVVAWTQNVTW